jgi:hypothetical protein
MKRFLIPLLLLAPTATFAGPAVLAQCMFNSECIEGEACEVTNYMVIVYENNAAPFTMESVSETITGEFIEDRGGDGNSTLFGTSTGAAHLLTIAPNGDARYSVQMDGPMIISYLGNCERAE